MVRPCFVATDFRVRFSDFTYKIKKNIKIIKNIKRYKKYKNIKIYKNRIKQNSIIVCFVCFVCFVIVFFQLILKKNKYFKFYPSRDECFRLVV